MSFDCEFINETLVCFICGINLGQQDLLKAHLSEHLQTDDCFQLQSIDLQEPESNEPHLIDDKINNYSDSNLSSKLKPKEIHECGACGKKFKRNDHLQKHLIIHSNAKPFLCLVCDKRFARKDRLKDHCVVHLSNGWSCYFCGKMFSQRCILRKHEMIHRGVKPFSCELCECRFSRKNDLLRHLSAHSGEKNHLCEVCGKRFSQKRLLKRHLNIHRNN